MLMTPLYSDAIESGAADAFRSGRYDCIWFAESRSHMALMSPVIMNVSSSSVPCSVPFHLMAVSSEFGYVFSNRRNMSGSLITPLIRSIVSSTSLDRNERQSADGRWYASPNRPADFGPCGVPA